MAASLYATHALNLARAESEGLELISIVDFEGLTDIPRETIRHRMGSLQPEGGADLYRLTALTLRCCSGHLPMPGRLADLRATARVLYASGTTYSVLGRI